MSSQAGEQLFGLANIGLLVLYGAGARLIPRRWRKLLLVVQMESVLAVGALGFVVGGRLFFVFAGLAVIWTVCFCESYQNSQRETREPAPPRHRRWPS